MNDRVFVALFFGHTFSIHKRAARVHLAFGSHRHPKPVVSTRTWATVGTSGASPKLILRADLACRRSERDCFFTGPSEDGSGPSFSSSGCSSKAMTEERRRLGTVAGTCEGDRALAAAVSCISFNSSASEPTGARDGTAPDVGGSGDGVVRSGAAELSCCLREGAAGAATSGRRCGPCSTLSTAIMDAARIRASKLSTISTAVAGPSAGGVLGRTAAWFARHSFSEALSAPRISGEGGARPRSARRARCLRL